MTIPFRLDPFYVDKSANVLYEAFMDADIKLYYELRGYKVHTYENPANDQIGREEYDTRVSNGDLWEKKQDRIWGTTGRVFLEVPHAHSLATHFLIKTFRPAAFRRHIYLSILDTHPHIQAGEYGRAEGILISLDELEQLNEFYVE